MNEGKGTSSLHIPKVNYTPAKLGRFEGKVGGNEREYPSESDIDQTGVRIRYLEILRVKLSAVKKPPIT